MIGKPKTIIPIRTRYIIDSPLSVREIAEFIIGVTVVLSIFIVPIVIVSVVYFL
tara:strand:+ start:73 stop:234 length:162 start_codon:yes stop_codon:yes gene_type:complete